MQNCAPRIWYGNVKSNQGRNCIFSSPENCISHLSALGCSSKPNKCTRPRPRQFLSSCTNFFPLFQIETCESSCCDHGLHTYNMRAITNLKEMLSSETHLLFPPSEVTARKQKVISIMQTSCENNIFVNTIKNINKKKRRKKENVERVQTAWFTTTIFRSWFMGSTFRSWFFVHSVLEQERGIFTFSSPTTLIRDQW